MDGSQNETFEKHQFPEHQYYHFISRKSANFPQYQTEIFKPKAQCLAHSGCLEIFLE